MKKFFVYTFILVLAISLSSCSSAKYSQEDMEAAVKTARGEAYDIGYKKGFEFGYAEGYVGGLNGDNMNVFSEQDEENENIVYFIVGGVKKYHDGDCPYLQGKQLSTFQDASEAEAAGFEPCSTCL